MAIEFINFDGESIPEEEFRQIFGAFEIEENEDAQYHVTELRAASGYPTFLFRVLDTDGNPVPGVAVNFQNGGSTIITTKDTGWAECPMYRGAFYELPAAGPHFIEFVNAPTIRVMGIGMLTVPPYAHFNVTTQEGEPEPPPPPPPDDLVEILLAAQAKNEEAGEKIAEALALLQGG